MDEIVETGAAQGLEEMVIGMAHRGRLNVLVNTLGKAPSELFAEFEGHYKSKDLPAGDVKYHNGFLKRCRYRFRTDPSGFSL
mgnify:CR=1 FL=1